MAKVKDTRVWTGKVRFTFPHLFKTHAFKAGDEPKYGVTILIPKSDKDTIKCIKQAFKAAVEKGKDAKFKGKIPPNLYTTLRDGDEERDTEEYPEYKGHFFMMLSSESKPGVVDKDGLPITDGEEVYSGCYGRVTMNAYAYNVKGNKGVSAGLQNVQKLADGDALVARRVPAEDDFEAWGDEDEDFEI